MAPGIPKALFLRILAITGIMTTLSAGPLSAAETASSSANLYEKVFQDLERDAAAGNAELAVTMGMISLDERRGEINQTQALEWFRKGAEGGDPFGMANYAGMLFADGKYVEGYAWALLAYERFKPGTFKDQALNQVTRTGDRLSREEIAAGQAIFQRLRVKVPFYAGKY